MRGEYVDVTEGDIPQASNRATVMQNFPDFVATLSHYLKPFMRDGSQFPCTLFHPRIDGWVPLNCAIESQQLRSRGQFSHGVLRATGLFQGATRSSYSMGSPKPSVWTPSW